MNLNQIVTCIYCKSIFTNKLWNSELNQENKTLKYITERVITVTEKGEYLLFHFL